MDYSRSETVVDALSGVNKIFLLVTSVPNTLISPNIVKEAKKNNVKHIVMLSSKAIDVKPETTIGRIHRQEEVIIEESGRNNI